MRPPRDSVRFTFDDTTDFLEVERTLELSRLAAAILHGPDRVDLEAPHEVDRLRRTVTVASGSEVGRTLSTIFLGFARREFGRTVLRCERQPAEVHP